jgi:methylenetetrahydrofolate--tRNA-(uracil-5-)-methyltransferase
MNVNFGLFPPIAGQAQGEKTRGAEKGRARKAAISQRAARDLDSWLNQDRAAE